MGGSSGGPAPVATTAASAKPAIPLSQQEILKLDVVLEKLSHELGMDFIKQQEPDYEGLKSFLLKESVDPNNSVDVDKYISFVKANKDLIALCEQLERETGVEIFTAEADQRVTRQPLIAFLNTVFGIAPDNPQVLDKVNGLIASYQAVNRATRESAVALPNGSDKVEDEGKRRKLLAIADQLDALDIKLIVVKEPEIDEDATIANVLRFLHNLDVNEGNVDNFLRDAQKIEKQLYDKAEELQNYGIEIITVKDNEPDYALIMQKTQTFLKLMGITAEDDYKAFVGFLSKLKSEKPKERLIALQDLYKYKIAYEAKALANIPKGVVGIFNRIVEVANLEQIAIKIGIQNYRLIVVQEPQEKEDRGVKIPKLRWYWMSPDGIISRVTEKEKKAIESSYLQIIMDGGFFKKAKVDYASNFSLLKGASIEDLLLFQALAQGIKKDTVFALKAMLDGNQTVDDVIKLIKKYSEEFEKSAKAFESAEGTAIARGKEVGGHVKKIESALSKGQVEAGLGNGRYSEYYLAREKARDAASVAIAAQQTAISKQKKAKEERLEFCKKLVIEESELESVLNFLQVLQSSHISSAEVNLERLGNNISQYNALTGVVLNNTVAKEMFADFGEEKQKALWDDMVKKGYIGENGRILSAFDPKKREEFRLKLGEEDKALEDQVFEILKRVASDSGSIVAVFDKKVSDKLGLAKKGEKELKPAEGKIVLSKKQAGKLNKHPITLTKSALAGIDGDPYHITLDDLSKQQLTMGMLRNVADAFTQRFQLNMLAPIDEEEANKLSNIIEEKRKGMEASQKYPEAKLLLKLGKSIKNGQDAIYTKDELSKLESLLASLRDQEKDTDKQGMLIELCEKISKDGKHTFRVRVTREGLSPEDKKVLTDFADAHEGEKLVISSLLPNDGELRLFSADEARDLLRVKEILRRVAWQLGENLPPRQRKDIVKDIREHPSKIIGEALDFVREEIDKAGQVAQRIDMPQALEEHLWMVFRWDNMKEEERAEFSSALSSLESAQQEFKASEKALIAKNKEIGAFEKSILAKGEKREKKEVERLVKLQKEAEALQEDLKAKEKKLREVKEQFIMVSHKYRLDSTVAAEDLSKLELRDYELVMPLLDYLMFEHNGLRYNKLPGKEITTAGQLAEFVSKNMPKDGWASIIRDPGESVETTLAKKIVLFIIMQKYYSKKREALLIPSLASVVPCANALKLAIVAGLAGGAIFADSNTKGASAEEQFVPPSWALVMPVIKQFYNLSQTVQTRPNENIAPYLHMLLSMVDKKDENHIYRKTTEQTDKTGGELSQVSTQDAKDFVCGIVDQVLGFNEYALEKIEKKIPQENKQAWELIRGYKDRTDAAEAFWKEKFEGKFTKDKFELDEDPALSQNEKEARAQLVKLVLLGMALLNVNDEVVSEALQAVSGGHIGAVEVERTLGRGFAFDETSYAQVGRVNVKYTQYGIAPEFNLGELALGAVNSVADFYLMPATFTNLGAQYLSDVPLGVRDAYVHGDRNRLIETAFSYGGLDIGITLWRSLPVVAFGEAGQDRDEGNMGAAIGSGAIMALLTIDNLRYLYHSIVDARNFLLNRPTMLQSQVGLFNWPTHLLMGVPRRLAKTGVDLVFSPEWRAENLETLLTPNLWGLETRRAIGARLSLLGDNRVVSGISSRYNAARDWLFAPSLENRWIKKQLGGAANALRVGWNVVSLNYQGQLLGWSGETPWLGLDPRQYLGLQGSILELGEGRSLSTTNSRLKKVGMDPESVGLSNGTQVSGEVVNGRVVRAEGNNPHALQTLRSNLSRIIGEDGIVFVGGEEEGRPMVVRVITVTQGNELNYAVHSDAGGTLYAEVIIGEDRINEFSKDEPVVNSFHHVAQELYGPEADQEGSFERIPEDRVRAIGSEVEGQLTEIDNIWKRHFDNASFSSRLSELRSAVADTTALGPDFRSLSHQEQIARMRTTTVTFAGQTISYTEARMLWIRALVQQTTGKVLTTAQVRAILLMHNGISVQMYAGTGKTIMHCALNILDHHMGRQMYDMTHNDLTAEANFRETRDVYRSAGLRVSVVRHGQAGLRRTFESSDVIYCSKTDLAFIYLGARTNPHSQAVINWENGLFRPDEFDFLFVDEGQNPHIISGGDKGKAETKAWERAYRLAEALRSGDYTEQNGIYELTQQGAERIGWARLTAVEQVRVFRCLQARGMERGQDFEIDHVRREIVVLNRNTGQADYGSSHGEGLHQALQARFHRRYAVRITAESSTIAQVSTRELIGKIHHMVATSGTLDEIRPVLDSCGIPYEVGEPTVPRVEWMPLEEGEEPERVIDRNIRRIEREVERRSQQVNIPGRERDIQIRGSAQDKPLMDRAIEILRSRGINANPFIKEPVLSFATQKEKVDAVIKKLREDLKIEPTIDPKTKKPIYRPIIISVDDPNLAVEIHQRLSSDPEAKKLLAERSGSRRIGLLAHGSERSYQGVFENNIENSYAILVTTLARRGTDIKTGNPEGLILYCVDQETGMNGVVQKLERVGRQGTAATLRIFTSLESAVYDAPLTREAYQRMVVMARACDLGRQFEGGINLQTSSFRDALNIFAAERAHNEAFQDVMNAHVEVMVGRRPRTVTILEASQIAYDEVIFARVEAASRRDRIVPQELKERLEDIRERFGVENREISFREKCEGIIAEELGFVLEHEGLTGEFIDLSQSVQRDQLTRALRRLEAMFHINLRIDIPNEGIFSIEAIAQNLGEQAAEQVFGYRDLSVGRVRRLINAATQKIEGRTLEGILEQEYLKFEMELQDVTLELVNRFEKEGRLVASTKHRSARAAFVEAYEQRLENLFERFRRRVNRAVRRQQAAHAVALFGREGLVGRRKRTRVNVDSGSIFGEDARVSREGMEERAAELARPREATPQQIKFKYKKNGLDGKEIEIDVIVGREELRGRNERNPLRIQVDGEPKAIYLDGFGRIHLMEMPTLTGSRPWWRPETYQVESVVPQTTEPVSTTAPPAPEAQREDHVTAPPPEPQPLQPAAEQVQAAEPARIVKFVHDGQEVTVSLAELEGKTRDNPLELEFKGKPVAVYLNNTGDGVFVRSESALMPGTFSWSFEPTPIQITGQPAPQQNGAPRLQTIEIDGRRVEIPVGAVVEQAAHNGVRLVTLNGAAVGEIARDSQGNLSYRTPSGGGFESWHYLTQKYGELASKQIVSARRWFSMMQGVAVFEYSVARGRQTFSSSTEAQYRADLEACGFSEAKINEMVGHVRWHRLEAKWGKEVAVILRTRISNEQMNQMTSNEFSKLATLRGLQDRGFSGEEIDRIGQEKTKVEERYKELVAKRKQKSQKPEQTSEQAPNLQTNEARLDRMVQYGLTAEQGRRAIDLAAKTREKIERGKAQALDQINNLEKRNIISSEEASQMRTEATQAWDEEILKTEAASADAVLQEQALRELKENKARLKGEIKVLGAKASAADKSEAKVLEAQLSQKMQELEAINEATRSRLSGFCKKHGMMVGFILVMDVVGGIQRGESEKIPETLLASFVGYGAFVGGEAAFKRYFGLTQGAAPAVTAATIAAVTTAYRHIDHFASSDISAMTLAGLDVGKETAIGYLSMKAMEAGSKYAYLAALRTFGATAGTAVGGPFGFVAGLLASTVVTYAAQTYLEEIGVNAALEKAFVERDIPRKLKEMSCGETKLVIKDDSEFSLPNFKYFEKTGKSGKSQAQLMLELLDLANNYFTMLKEKSDKEILAYQAVPKNAQFIKAFEMFRSIRTLNLDNYSSLTPEALDKVYEAIESFRANEGSSTPYMNLVVTVTSKEVPIINPLTSDVAGSYRVYTITIDGAKHQRVLINGINARGHLVEKWEAIPKTAKSEIYSVNGMIQGDTKRLEDAAFFAQREKHDARGNAYFDVDLYEVVERDISIPISYLYKMPKLQQQIFSALRRKGYDLKKIAFTSLVEDIFAEFAKTEELKLEERNIYHIPQTSLQRPWDGKSVPMVEKRMLLNKELLSRLLPSQEQEYGISWPTKVEIEEFESEIKYKLGRKQH